MSARNHALLRLILCPVSSNFFNWVQLGSTNFKELVTRIGTDEGKAMVTRQGDKYRGRGLLRSGIVRVSEGKYEINSYDDNGVTRAHGWFEPDQENRLRWLDPAKAELWRKRNDRRLKLVIANLPSIKRIQFDVHEDSIPELLSKQKPRR